MMVYTSGGFPTLADAAKGKYELGVAPFPGVDGHPGTSDLAGSGLAILAQDQAKARAAWSFVKFLTSDDSYKTIAASMGYLPLRPAATSAADPRLQTVVDRLGNLAPYTPFPGKQSNQAVTILVDEAVGPVMFHGADPASTLHTVAQKIKSTLGN
jgi:multiple sugar transport system substrate-binding protein